MLDGWLEAALIDDPYQAANGLASLDSADLTLMASSDADVDAPHGTLAAFTHGPAAARRLLARVRTASSLDEARGIATRLGDGETVVTPSGEWLGRGFARVLRGAGSQVGVIAREREIREGKERAATLEREIATHVDAAATGKQARIEAEQARDDTQRDVYTAHRRLAELSGQLQSHRGRIDSARERMARVAAELKDREEDRRRSRPGARSTRAARSGRLADERA